MVARMRGSAISSRPRWIRAITVLIACSLAWHVHHKCVCNRVWGQVLFCRHRCVAGSLMGNDVKPVCQAESVRSGLRRHGPTSAARASICHRLPLLKTPTCTCKQLPHGASGSMGSQKAWQLADGTVKNYCARRQLRAADERFDGPFETHPSACGCYMLKFTSVPHGPATSRAVLVVFAHAACGRVPELAQRSARTRPANCAHAQRISLRCWQDRVLRSAVWCSRGESSPSALSSDLWEVQSSNLREQTQTYSWVRAERGVRAYMLVPCTCRYALRRACMQKNRCPIRTACLAGSSSAHPLAHRVLAPGQQWQSSKSAQRVLRPSPE
jgi:hypothetical protein